VIEIMERDGLVERSDALANRWQDDMRAAFGSHPIVGEIRGRGFWQAIDFTADRSTKAVFEDDTVKEIVRRTRQQGVLVSPIGTAIEIAPPLISSEGDLRQCTAALAKAIDEVARERGLA
jgi:putrescine aminotransferase